LERTTQDILRDARATLGTAELGLSDLLNGPPDRRLPGLRNLITFGRAVTNVLQNLRSTESGFDKWYAPFRDKMAADPLMKHFYDLRSVVLKEGVLGTMPSAHIREMYMPDFLERMGPEPPGATGFFMGDQTGGSGWEVVLPDGSTEKYYVEVPEEIAVVRLRFPDPPSEHLGQPLRDQSVENLASLYMDYLRSLVGDASRRFGQPD
jgi:hypothetical protein